MVSFMVSLLLFSDEDSIGVSGGAPRQVPTAMNVNQLLLFELPLPVRTLNSVVVIATIVALSEATPPEAEMFVGSPPPELIWVTVTVGSLMKAALKTTKYVPPPTLKDEYPMPE